MNLTRHFGHHFYTYRKINFLIVYSDFRSFLILYLNLFKVPRKVCEYVCVVSEFIISID